MTPNRIVIFALIIFALATIASLLGRPRIEVIQGDMLANFLLTLACYERLRRSR